MSFEDDAYDFILAAIEDAVEGDPLFAAELHDTLYRPIKKQFGVRIGDAEAALAPDAGAAEIQEFDSVVPLVVYRLVAGPDRTDRAAARAQVTSIARAVATLFNADPTMGGRVNDSRVPRLQRGWDVYDSSPYAIVNMPLLVNETGGALP